jgi:hypothetical protein
MPAYSTIDYLPDLTSGEISNAGRLSFVRTGTNSVGWDYSASVFGSEPYALLHHIYSFTAIEGASYDIFSTSYFDPFIVLVYDQYGNVIAANSETDDGADIYLSDGGYYSQDVIFDWVAPYSGTYYVSGSWNQGSYFDFYSLNLYEDRDTITVDRTSPVISVVASDLKLGVGETATITFTLSESSSNFVATDIAVSGGTLSNFVGDGAIYTALFTPASNSIANGVVSVASGAFSDIAGNLNADGLDSNNSVRMTVNTVLENRKVISALDVIVDKGVLSVDAVLLKGLVETVVYQNGVISSHTIDYGATTFDYSSIDNLISRVLDNGIFTEEFAKEIADYVPSVADISYQDAVRLVGVLNIDSVILAVAGSDGFYVS